MYLRNLGFALGLAFLLGFVAGCKKSASVEVSKGDAAKPPLQSEPQKSPPLDLIARVHWLGMKRLATETNAAHFMSIWNLPETAKLQNQTLDKLALWLAGGAQL